jgi:predicted TIM-barrel fold metal-dependent hydrolase
MNRREFVVGAGVLAGATAIGAGVSAKSIVDTVEPILTSPASTVEKFRVSGRIDVHHSIYPPVWIEALQQGELSPFRGASLSSWTVQKSLDLLDQQGIHTAITSVTAPGVSIVGALARHSNEFAAEMTVAHPGRFGSFAVLPVPATDQACAEAIYALDTLHADGVTLWGSCDGVFLGDPRFDELMSELDRRHASVFLQPNIHASSTKLGLNTPPFAVEYACDITRAAVNLIFTGTLERFPRINWILANGGGFLPYAAWRISLANALPEFGELVPQGVMTYLQRFYFETALSSSTASMAVLKELVDPSKILFGSGFPQASSDLVGEQIAMLKDSPLWSSSELSGIERGHALRLFSRYHVPGELVAPAPVNESESTAQWVGRMAKKPLGALAQQLKD